MISAVKEKEFLEAILKGIQVIVDLIKSKITLLNDQIALFEEQERNGI